MLYSQVNYIGCFLPISDAKQKIIQSKINRFVTGGLNISEKRLYLNINSGGLGIFELGSFLAEQKCSWIKRAQNIDELWKCRLNCKSFRNVLNLRANCFDYETEPILTSIVASYENFFLQYSKTANYINAFIFDNPSLTINFRNDNKLVMQSFDPNT